MDVVDNALTNGIGSVVTTALGMAGSLATLIYASPSFFPFIFPLAFFYSRVRAPPAAPPEILLAWGSVGAAAGGTAAGGSSGRPLANPPLSLSGDEPLPPGLPRA